MCLSLLIGFNYTVPSWIKGFNQKHYSKEAAAIVANTDFSVYYHAGRSMRLGDDPYVRSGYIYPPAMLLVFGEFSRLTYDTARVSWLALYMMLYVASIMALALTVEGELRRYFLGCAAILTLSSSPLTVLIAYGQADLLVSAVIIVAFVAYSRGHKLAAAVALSIATFVKLHPAGLLTYFVLLHRDYKFFIFYVLITFAIGLASMSLVPVGLYQEYFVKVLPGLTDKIPSMMNQSVIRAVGATGGWVPAMALAAAIPFMLLVHWIGDKQSAQLGAQRNQGYRAEDALFRESNFFFMNLLVILLFSPISWHTYYVAVILPSALLLAYLIRQGDTSLILVTGVGICLMHVRYFDLSVLHAANALGGAITLGCLVWLASRDMFSLKAKSL